ncbi:ATP-dependent DNA helicase pfh1 [Holothuria leucospilota]|uniref:ATP-dependent DNA helicase n=1 Tax=Holothuria leucospilota TaxID=206669 RepID=A0A9Q1CRZ4_HOLLE|nr:ATP-dependent DNA helicase pfh1 [Holothuria leucospilota]
MGNQLPFGGVSIIAVGDLFQLKPVMDQWIFSDLEQGYGPLTQNLWKQFFTVHELTQIMRQKDDKEFAELLNRLRKGQHTETDIATLRSCAIHNQTEVPPYVPRLYPTNALVNQYNEAAFNSSNTEKVTILAQDFIPGNMTDSMKQQAKNSIPDNPNKTCGLLTTLQVALNSRYEIVCNIDVEDGLKNKVTAIRQQFPLRPASAKTIHKAQGDTATEIVVIWTTQ